MEEWFRQEELKKQEEKYRLNEVIPNNLNDFGSYKLMLKEGDIEKSNITNHNDIIPKEKIKSIERVCKNLFAKPPNKILNLGCGLGFETIALSEIYNCEITGIDISKDGINYAKKYNNNSKTNYISKVIDKNFLLNKKFDACYAIEFYPFTRTENLEFQKNIVSAIFKNLNIGAPLIIYQLDTEKNSIHKNIKEISSLLNIKSKVISKFHPKIFRLVPNLSLVNFLCSILEFFFNKTYGKTIIIFRK